MSLLKPFVHFWCSLRLTVVCLIAAMVLVFVGTLAQVDQGLYDAQKKYFRSYFLVPESIGGAGWAQIRIGGSEWVTPTNWSETEPSQFSLINFEARHGDNTATISVTKLAKNAGLLNNVNRWRGQLGLEKIDQAELTETTRPFEVDGNSGTYIEMSGTRDGRPAMTLGVIHSLSYRTLPEIWFYKITGNTDAVMKEKGAFEEYVRSARYPVMFRFPFVGGYLVGIVLLINLLAAHFQRFTFSRKKIGIFLTHAGLIFMLLGQLVTDKYQVESNLRLVEGQSKGYSISGSECELVLIDKSRPDTDIVAAIPAVSLEQSTTHQTETLPFEFTILEYYTNSDLGTLGQGEENKATRGKGLELAATPRPSVTSLEEVNFPAAYLRLKSTGGKELGTWMVSALFGALKNPIPEQTFEFDGKEYELALRFTRHYTPYDIELVDFKHDKFQGTEKARNFSSLVIVRDRASGAEREVNIWMNHPLRYEGKTYFQASFDPENAKATVLQVVRNPGWVTPYISCAMVGMGMLIQFLTHLFSFNKKRKAAA
ncbi:MAG: cytochrome c biogenesis protein ResB [Verrucomicrobiota bacterium]|nr:cytochrome c biogenesis protein ResB [Verrucomicrobiota bacterium]